MVKFPSLIPFFSCTQSVFVKQYASIDPIKIAVNGAFLYFAQNVLFDLNHINRFQLWNRFIQTRSVSRNYLIQTIVMMPLIEEIVFRGGLLRSVQFFQSKKEKECFLTSRLTRICVATFIWTMLHFYPAQSHSVGVARRASWLILGGLTYGYLTEHFQSLALAYCAHGVNNIFCFAKVFYPKNRFIHYATILYPFALFTLIAKPFLTDLMTLNRDTCRNKNGAC